MNIATHSTATHSTATRNRVLAMLREGHRIAAVIAATGVSDVTIRAWAKRAGVPIPTTRRPRPEAPPPPPPVGPRRIPFAGCEHFRMGHRTLCTACFCAVQRGEAVLG